MPAPGSEPTRDHQPIVLIRGFGGLNVEDEKQVAYQGFNDGTVYPRKRGENYIYEGMILRFMKSNWRYQDATNVVGYFGRNVPLDGITIPQELKELDPKFFSGSKVVTDPGMALRLLEAGSGNDISRSIWVFRYYDLDDRLFKLYGEMLVRLIDFIRALARVKNKGAGGKEPKVNIIAHSMGGLIVREAIQRTYPNGKRQADQFINKVVTLGTPHQGISFQLLRNWMRIDPEDELKRFNPEMQEEDQEIGYKAFKDHFPLERLLTVVGTNYRTYAVTAASVANRFFSVIGEYGPNYNRSDGLVKQTSAQIPGALRTFVHKCHGGPDSLVTSREAFEIATRFFFGDVHVRLSLVEAEVLRGFDLIGRSELFFGVSIKPRGVDFELFHQSAEAENCYGPFRTGDFSDPAVAFDWAGPDRLIWEGWLDTSAIRRGPNDVGANPDIVMRLDVYVGERDLLGLGFSDNVIFRKQYYVRAELGEELKLWLHDSESFREGQAGKPMTKVDGAWDFEVSGTGFRAIMRISFESVPE